ncbi:MAG: hypothetical protein JRI94_04330 [Deltaproteobacteria bacterium]|nr:hypothetical protein [Deltaproteobacteria bacterium]
MDDVEKRVGKDGKVDYFMNGEKISTVNETLEDIVACFLETFEGLFSLIHQQSDELDEVCFVGKALVRDAERLFQEANEFISKEFGTIWVEKATWNQTGIPGGIKLGVKFKDARV